MCNNKCKTNTSIIVNINKKQFLVFIHSIKTYKQKAIKNGRMKESKQQHKFDCWKCHLQICAFHPVRIMTMSSFE